VKAFLYARVSTVDKEQNPEVQLREMREYCERRKWSAATEFVDHMSGTNSQRPQWQEMLRLVRQRCRFPIQPFRSIDKRTRELAGGVQGPRYQVCQHP
jgi:hypothetical protein